MAVTTNTINVNSGNANWTRAHVMTALETLFGSSHLNWNSGTQQNGVPVCCLYPGHDGTANTQNSQYNQSSHEDRIFDENGYWGRCGGAAVNYNTGGADAGTVDGKDGYSAKRYLYVTNNGTTSYLIQDELIPASNGVDNSTDVITLTHSMGSNLTTGTKVTYNGQGTNTAVITGLAANNVYYMRRIGPNKITLHTSQAGANDNNSKVDVTSTSLTDPLRLRTDTAVNPTITVKRGERLYWYTHAMNQGTFAICEVTPTSGAYSADRDLTTESNLSDYTFPAKSYYVSGSGTYASPFFMDTEHYPQTETEVYNPQKVSGTGYTGLHSWGYCNATKANLKGSIVILPDYNYELAAGGGGNDFRQVYWKYTVPASGSRGALKLRVYRDTWSTDGGEVSGISIHNVATGWSANQAFTIPGEDIGGAATTHDITFGTNAYTSGTNNTPSIVVTNHGAVDNMFQKHPSGDFGVLRMENQSGKTFGTTYWVIGIDPNNYRMHLDTGHSWQTLNSLGTNCNTVTTIGDMNGYGVFGGDMGLDVMSNRANIDRDPYTYTDEAWLKFATSSSPTQYPLKIKYFKAPNSQDNNFAVIQFIQEIGGVDESFACFTLHRGSTFGAGVWDLDYVWNGSYTEYTTQYQINGTRDRWIDMEYKMASHADANSERPYYEPPISYSKAREASYGYLRNGTDGSSRPSTATRYIPNIRTPHEYNSYISEVTMYYRDNTYDKATGGTAEQYGAPVLEDVTNSVSSSAAYYKPIKGIPINNRFAPCPYYIPDDFVMIQFEVTPPATIFRAGDTITVAVGEVYTVICADNEINVTGLSGSSSAVGIAFAARTT